MAAKRITQSAINWASIAERVPEAQKVSFLALKGKSDGYLRRVLANPEAAPKIDFSAYKSKIPLPGLVDTFQKEYEKLKIPYPTENLTPLIDAQEKEATEELRQFVAASKKRMEEHHKALDKWDKTLPFEDMTMQDYAEMFPEKALQPMTNPTWWPHTPDEQDGYVEPGIQQQKH